MCHWFLREEDSLALLRGAGKQRDGSSVRHSRAASLKWLRNACGIPFEVSVPAVKRTSRTSLGREPAFTSMWEVSTLSFLLRLVCFFDGGASQPDPTIVRSYAAGAYILAVASLRQIDGLRSALPTLEHCAIEPGRRVPCFFSTASLTKGKRRSSMRPMPWWAPAISLDPAITDDEALAGLQRAWASTPASARSLFPALANKEGKLCSLHDACSFGPGRASASRLGTSLAWLFTWRPLGMSAAESKKVGRDKHGPRHTFPEVSRVYGIPITLRDELGRWKVQGGRLSRLSNRYSREAERLLQVAIRTRIMVWIRSRLPVPRDGQLPFARLQLAHFAASSHSVLHNEAFARAVVEVVTRDGLRQ